MSNLEKISIYYINDTPYTERRHKGEGEVLDMKTLCNIINELIDKVNKLQGGKSEPQGLDKEEGR